MNSGNSMNCRSNEKVLQTAYKYLSYRSRTVNELRVYLIKKGFLQEQIAAVVSYLIDHSYLNDHRFCELYLEYHTRYKPKSKFAYRYDLRQKGINESVIDKALSIYDDQKLAIAAIEKRRHQWDNCDEAVFKKKALAHLNYKGFDWHSSLSALQAVTKGSHSDEN